MNKTKNQIKRKFKMLEKKCPHSSEMFFSKKVSPPHLPTLISKWNSVEMSISNYELIE